ncbi:MAG: DNA cytosine methyltransferase [Shinella sp.]|uniref:DNA cytosine methyltransferase n=1 Tax=Shinella sp. TaxID=1870904 RepID=UPI004035FD14
MTIRYGSVCSGIEAATRAFHALGWSPAFFAEIEKFPSAVLAHWYGSNMPGEPLATNGVPNYGDFTQIGADAGPVDLLVGGTPCQSFSVAGKRLGLDDPRGNLALEYLALARRLGARWILWENVPGVLSSSSSDEPAEEGEEAEGLESADFATFLSFVQECGYGFAYRVLDTQYVRVDEYARAVPQRRRRVFVVGYLGDWRRAAAVLLEPDGMRWDSPPRREPRSGIAIGALAGTSPGGGWRIGADEAAAGQIVAEVAATLPSGGNATGGDRQPGTSAETAGTMLVAEVVPFDTTQITSAANYSSPLPGDPCHPLAAGAHPPAVAFQERGRDGGRSVEWQEDLAYSLNAPAGGGRRQEMNIAWSIMPQNSSKDYKARQVDVAQPLMAGGPVGGNQGGDFIQQAWAVRRLTPRECERLQGFPDDFTSVPFNGKPAADGPRYKALGNSMAVNVMCWLGQRIDIMEKLIQSGALDAPASKSKGSVE